MFSADILKLLSHEHSVAEHVLDREMFEFAYLIIIHSGVEQTIFEFTQPPFQGESSSEVCYKYQFLFILKLELIGHFRIL